MRAPAFLVAILCGALAPQEVPESAPPRAEHAWLQQLVGDWVATFEATMEPGAAPMQMETTETVRAIGKLWIQAEGSASMGGAPFTSIQTLGYDPGQEAFVGSWIDSMQTHLWIYRGQLDESRRVLSLETEGPSFDDPTRTASYRDVIELKDSDHRLLTSAVKAEDGTWTVFLRAEYRRR